MTLTNLLPFRPYIIHLDQVHNSKHPIAKACTLVVGFDLISRGR